MFFLLSVDWAMQHQKSKQESLFLFIIFVCTKSKVRVSNQRAWIEDRITTCPKSGKLLSWHSDCNTPFLTKSSRNIPSTWIQSAPITSWSVVAWTVFIFFLQGILSAISNFLHNQGRWLLAAIILIQIAGKTYGERMFV